MDSAKLVSKNIGIKLHSHEKLMTVLSKSDNQFHIPNYVHITNYDVAFYYVRSMIFNLF